MRELKIDKEFAALCPPLTDAELDGLMDSILDEGCREPIIVWGDVIVDGHNRYRICRKIKRDYRVVEKEFANRDEAKVWILRNQLGRRNLTDGQRAMLAARLANLSAGRPSKNPEKTGSETPHLCGVSQTDAAEVFNVSARSVTNAKKVLTNGAASLIKAVEAGEIPVTTAAALADLPKDEQKKVVAKGPKAAKKKAASRRRSRIKDDGSDLLADAQAPYNMILQSLKAIRTAFNVMVEDKRHGAYLIEKRTRIQRAIDEVRDPIAMARPERLCECQGHGCQKCRGSGWWTKAYVQSFKK
jgi:hypothetical protein